MQRMKEVVVDPSLRDPRGINLPLLKEAMSGWGGFLLVEESKLIEMLETHGMALSGYYASAW